MAATEQKLIEELSTGDVFKLYYARGINPRCELIFKVDGGLQSAISRARSHCEKMNYKFIRCEPFLVNLDEVEKRFERES
jgi:hypothetical protein